jgi:hypothetical protein
VFRVWRHICGVVHACVSCCMPVSSSRQGSISSYFVCCGMLLTPDAAGASCKSQRRAFELEAVNVVRA